MGTYKTWEGSSKMQYSFYNPDAAEDVSPYTFSSDRGKMVVVQTHLDNDFPEFIVGRLDINSLSKVLTIGEYEIPICVILRLETIADTTGALITKLMRPAASVMDGPPGH